ncbi:MAG: chemotaxis protein CheW [Pseudomonadota bacterium]|nr:chemotaxis protein CheW [Pseudomonadota bacterium]
MNDEKQDDLPISDTERQIYSYLDEMLHDPAAGQPVSVQPELGLVIPDNVARFDRNKKKAALSTPAALPAAPSTSPATSPSTSPSSSRPVRQSKEAKPLALIERPALLSESLLSESFLRAPDPAPESTPPVLPEPVETESRQTVPTEPVPTAPAPNQVEPASDESTPEVLIAGLETDRAVDRSTEEPAEQHSWCPNGRPQWAQSRFECLIFTVNGLKLAVPLVLLGSIHPIDRKFNALPGQYDWFIGILQTPSAGNIKVLDTGLCVMPERHDPASRESLAYVITIHGFAWGLACHRVEKSVTLEPDQVKWRTQRGKRPWLAGTVLDYMCSLVDTDGFQHIINQAEQGI